MYDICGMINPLPGLQEVQVSSVEEAMLLLKLGLRHRHVASTRLNYQSSRSHTIFTIKLIKMVNTERPHKAMVNRWAIRNAVSKVYLCL